MREVRGGCGDLAAAFRRLARRPAHAAFSVVAVWNPRAARLEWYLLDALAFGEGAAVYGFNRVARALHRILAHFGVVVANYVDDFPIVVPEALAESAVATFLGVMELLGWRVMRPLELRLERVFGALGVQFDLVRLRAERAFVVRNRERRVADGVEAIGAVPARGTLRPPEARRSRGRLRFAASQLFGRVGPALREWGPAGGESHRQASLPARAGLERR